jgi:hypothetical protein
VYARLSIYSHPLLIDPRTFSLKRIPFLLQQFVRPFQLVLLHSSPHVEIPPFSLQQILPSQQLAFKFLHIFHFFFSLCRNLVSQRSERAFDVVQVIL